MAFLQRNKQQDVDIKNKVISQTLTGQWINNFKQKYYEVREITEHKSVGEILLFSSDQLNSILKEAMARLNDKGQKNAYDKNDENSARNTGGKLTITPSQALVIAGIIGGVLNVDSVLVGIDQRVEIILTGSLKQKTGLEKMMDQIGSMPFDEVVKALIGRLT